MNDLSEKLKEICLRKTSLQLYMNTKNIDLIIEVGTKLANLLLQQNAVNTVWICNDNIESEDSILSYLPCLDDEVIGELLQKGLDLNLINHNGFTSLTFKIGNAENKSVYRLLDLAKKYQTHEQRAVWINKPDRMIRRTRIPQGFFENLHTSMIQSMIQMTRITPMPQGFFENLHTSMIQSMIQMTRITPMTQRFFENLHTSMMPRARQYAITPLEQTALQLSVAKGYIDRDSLGRSCLISNFQITEKLLELGANTAIDYQEPAKGNTALHIAYARRDLKTIELLELYGANREIMNKEGQKPTDLLALTFEQTNNLLCFHTSAGDGDNHFLLESSVFHDQNNLLRIHQLLDTSPTPAEQKSLQGAGGPG